MRRYIAICALVSGLLYSCATAGDSPAKLQLPLRNPSIVVFKRLRQLLLYSESEVVRKYRIGLGTNPVGPKRVAGDRRTPEGQYYVCIKNPKSAYYLSLGISYPNQNDAEAALKRGDIARETYKSITTAINRRGVPPWHTRLGGEIFIHGRGSQFDWTWGCMALDDRDMRELYDAVPVGTPITISP